MTEFDQRDLAVLLASLYGGAAPEVSFCERLMQRTGFQLPCLLRVATTALGQNLPEFAGQWLAYELHPGFFLVLDAEGGDLPQSWRKRLTCMGPPVQLSHARQLHSVLQRAIVSLRRKQLGQEASCFSSHEEKLASAAVIRSLKVLPGRDASGQQSAVQEIQRWLLIILTRHQRQMQEMRRKVWELVTRLTGEVDQGLDREFRSVSQCLDVEHDIMIWQQMLPGVLLDLAWAVQKRKRLESSTAGMSKEVPEIVRQALAYLRDHGRESIAIADCAQALAVSHAHLARLFRRSLGKSPMDCLHQLRVEHMQDCLASGEHSVLSSALAAGFGSAEHASRTFKRVIGVSPQHWLQAQTS